MRKFLVKFVVFCSVIGIMATLISTLGDNGLKHSSLFEWSAWNDIFQGRVDDDVVIFGSSRGYGSYNPEIIETVAGCSCMNLSMTGYTMTQIVQRYKAYIENNAKPKLIVLNVDYHVTFDICDYPYDLSQYLPYYDSKFFDDYFSSIGIGWPKRNLPFLKYSDYVDVFWTGIRENFRPSKTDHYKGYMNKPYPFDGKEFNLMLDNGDSIDVPCSHEAFELCDWMIEDCQSRGIDVAICRVPYYEKATALFNHSEKVDDYLQNTTRKYNIPFFDYSHVEIESDTAYFSNATHLNARGAEVVSKLLGNDIAKLMTKNNN